MTDRAALLAAVCDRPDDDTPRLVYADWCDDHGDPDYAAFIRAQVELARVPEWDRRWVRAWHRDRDLFSGRRCRDRYPIPEALRSGLTFRRGFPWGVEAETPQAFALYADDLFATAPIQSFTVRARSQDPLDVTPRDVSPLAAHPGATRLRRLAFAFARLDAGAVRRLADAPGLAGLTELSFEFSAVLADGVAELLRSGLRGRLTRLRLHGNDPIPAGALRAFGGPSSLRSLTLSSGALIGTSATHPFAAPLFRGLTELDLSGNALGPAGVAALAAAPVAATLESLTLWQTGPGVPGVRALAASPALANLRRLSLRTCGLGPVAVKAIAQSPHLRNLTVLDLSGNAIGDKGAVALAESPYLRNLADLDLASPGLTDRGAAALLDSPVTARLERLNLPSLGTLSPAMIARIQERFG